jgi:hypothetical protein
MDWKLENPKSRYIDSIKWEEAKEIAYLAAGKPEEFELLEIKTECNGNNIPHVKLHYRYLEPVLGNGEVTYIGIFHNLNTYEGSHFNIVYCQVELFKKFTEFGFN